MLMQTNSIYKNKNAIHASDLPDAILLKNPDYLKLILTANVYDVAIETPLQRATQLSNKTRNNILIKREDLQPVFSFKLRGAYNRMLKLSQVEREKGVITCSAGNHAQGVALAAQKMGINAIIVMPLMTPPIKWKNVERLGAQVLLFGSDFEEAKAECYRLSKLKDLTVIHPYDDPYIIAGQGTIGMEIMRQTDPIHLDAIFVCVGGGGLASGIASYVKRLYPHIKIIGVETYDANCMTLSLIKGQRQTLDSVGLFADGAAVRTIGEETFRICKDLIDEMVLVSTDEICAAIKDVFEDTRSIVEPAGALGIAGCKKYITERGIIGKNYVAIMSGANMNFDRLRFVAERAELGEKREVLLSVVIPEQIGSFMKLYQTIDPFVITEFSYRYNDKSLAHIFMSLYLDDREKQLSRLITDLEYKGMKAVDASFNEMAKSHGRYMSGGGIPLENERLFQFIFPERPGALKSFLENLPADINVSTFHYRSDGGDVGKVFVGMQISPDKQNEFKEFLDRLKYSYVEETENPLVQTLKQTKVFR